LLHEEKSVTDRFIVQKMAESYCLPFVNTFPWLKESLSNASTAAALLMVYIWTSKPLVICAFGTVVRDIYTISFVCGFQVLNNILTGFPNGAKQL
jgi:hypothetical protein